MTENLSSASLLHSSSIIILVRKYRKFNFTGWNLVFFLCTFWRGPYQKPHFSILFELYLGRARFNIWKLINQLKQSKPTFSELNIFVVHPACIATKEQFRRPHNIYSWRCLRRFVHKHRLYSITQPSYLILSNSGLVSCLAIIYSLNSSSSMGNGK